MSDYCISTPAALAVSYSGTAGSLTGYTSPDLPGMANYKLVTTTDAWVCQGIADTVILSGSASADTLTSSAPNQLITGMPLQVAALGDTAISQAWQVTAAGPTFVDLTTAINNSTANDAQPFPTGEVSGDYCALGYTTTFGTLKINVGTAGTVGTLTWEYWNGTAWASLTGVTDNTTGLTVSGSHTIVFTVPSDWAATVLNGSASLYYVRAKVTGAYTVDPLITQAWVDGVLPTGLSASTTYWAIVVSGTVFKLATTRANALAGTAINLTSNGGGVTASTVAVANSSGSAFVPAKVLLDIDGAFGAKISVVQDASSGEASLYPVLAVR